MTKTEIAKTIIDICHNDAAFCRDIKGGDPAFFLSGITDDMPERAFLFSVDRYLATFKVWGHLYFYSKRFTPYIGFQVRRYGEVLYVTHAEEGLPLAKGDEIVAVDGLSIERAAQKFAVFFDSDPPDRQGERWQTVIANSASVTVRSCGQTFDYAVRTDVRRGRTEPTTVCKFVDNDCYYIKLTNFFDEGDISAIVDNVPQNINKTTNLIIDLRNNCGGSDTVFLPLLKYLLTERDEMCGKPIFTAEDETLFSERNADGRIAVYKEYLAGTTSDEVRRYIEAQIKVETENRGKGFFPTKTDDFRFPSSGTRYPEKVVVLTDCNCASSAENFVEIAHRLHKVKLIGRPTMGICDYSNLTRFDFGEYVLHYPTSRAKAIDEGRGTRGRGILPDILVPWSPEHLTRDPDLSAALEYFKNSN